MVRKTVSKSEEGKHSATTEPSNVLAACNIVERIKLLYLLTRIDDFPNDYVISYGYIHGSMYEVAMGRTLGAGGQVCLFANKAKAVVVVNSRKPRATSQAEIANVVKEICLRIGVDEAVLMKTDWLFEAISFNSFVATVNQDSVDWRKLDDGTSVSVDEWPRSLVSRFSVPWSRLEGKLGYTYRYKGSKPFLQRFHERQPITPAFAKELLSDRVSEESLAWVKMIAARVDYPCTF